MIAERPEEVYQAVHRLLTMFRKLGLLGNDKFTASLSALKQTLQGETKVASPSPPADEVVEERRLPPVVPPVRPATPVAASVPPAVSKPPTSIPSPRALPVVSRVEQYAASRQAAAAEARAAAPTVPQPKRDWGRVFQAFLESHNIMWGELVGGLLIVVCSIALVISFWAEIAERPLLKFGLFSGVSAAMFAAGFYTDRRWRIRTTSHGVLMIAMLLVPLNFLAIAAFTSNSPPTDLLSFAGEGISLALFSLLTWFAARVVTPHAPLATTASLMICSLMLLVVRRFAGPEAPFALVYLLATIPLLSYAAAVLLSLRRSVPGEPTETISGISHFVLIGLTLFATLLPLALLIHKLGPLDAALQQLAPLLVLLGGPALATTLVLWKHIAPEPPALKVALASLGVLGGMILLASVGLSWPLPAALVATALANATLWLLLAWFANLPRLQLLAAALLALGWMIAIPAATGQIAWETADGAGLLRSIFSAAGGARLLPMVALFATIGLVSQRLANRSLAFVWGQSAMAAMALSTLLLAVFGFGRLGDHSGATWYFALYALLLTLSAAALNHRKLAVVAVALLLLSVIQGIVFRYGQGWLDERAWIFATLALGAIATTLAAATRFIPARPLDHFRWVMAIAGLAASIAAAAMLVALGWRLETIPLALGYFWLAGLWLLLAWLWSNSQLFIAFQATLAAALGVVVTTQLAGQTWFATGAARWVDPWFWQAQGIALAGSAIVWRLLRITLGQSPMARSLAPDADFTSPPWATFDRTVAIGVAALTFMLAAYAVFPGMAQELSPSVDNTTRLPIPVVNLELPHVSSAHAAGAGSWILLIVILVLVGMGCWDRRPSLSLLGLSLLGAVPCLLAAARFADQVATASALRWLLGSYALVATLPIVARRQLRPWLVRLGISLDTPPPFVGSSLAQAGRTVVVALVIGLYVAVAGFAIVAALTMGPATPGAGPLLLATGGLAIVMGVVWLGLSWQKWSPTPAADNLPSGRIVALGRLLVACSAGLPLAVAFAYIITSKLAQQPLLGPEPASWFGQLGNSWLYGGPLALLALVLLVFAIRELSSRYAFSFGLLAGGVATLVYLLELAARQGALDAVAWISLAQLNATVAAIISLCWWGAIAWHSRRHNVAPPPRPILLQVLAGLAAMFSAETLLAGCVGILLDPLRLTWETAVAGINGLGSVALAVTSLWLINKPPRGGYQQRHLVGLVLLAVTLLPNLVGQFDTGRLQAFHSLLVACAVAGWLLVTLPERWRAIGWSLLFAGLTLLAALHELGLGSTPQWPWWGIAGLLSVAGLLWRVAQLRGIRWPVWLAAPVLMIAGHTFWWEVLPQRGANELVNFLDLNALLLAIAAGASVLVEFAWKWQTPVARSPRPWLIGFHRFAVWFAILWLLLAVAVELTFGGGTPPWPTNWWLGLIALGGTVAATYLTLWDRQSRWPVAAFYCLGLVAVGRFLGALRLEGEDFTWAFTLALGAFVLATSYLWQRREAIAGLAIRLGAPRHLRRRLDSQVWMLAANGLAIIVIVWLVTMIEFTYESFNHRMTSAYTLLASALSLALLAAGRAEVRLRYSALAMGGLFAIAFAWAWIPPTFPAANLHRLVAAAVAVAVMIPIYGTLFVKIWRRTTPWVEAAQETIPGLVTLAGVLLALTLVAEVAAFVAGQPAPLVWPAILAVALAIAGLVVSCLAAALIPGRDPFRLNERGRTVYVYAAEVFVGLWFLHIRVTMPWLFSGWFLQYWPLVVMLIAFVGVGLSEWFTRRKAHVLAEPLGNTALFLPLLPLVGFWSSGQGGQYALLLVAVGLLYSAMSTMRKSPLLMGLALLAFNGSLWTTLHAVDGWGLLQHPQFWLIPPMLCVLIGAEFNRSRLSPTQLSTIRYACGVMIYAASTADIFINGVGLGMWLPMLLAALAIAGVFAGILLRVRAFLFLGVAFLCVSLFSVVWHAAVELDRTWIWWVAGIASGVAIIALFGLFEKKRDEALLLVEQLKQWDS